MLLMKYGLLRFFETPAILHPFGIRCNARIRAFCYFLMSAGVIKSFRD